MLNTCFRRNADTPDAGPKRMHQRALSDTEGKQGAKLRSGSLAKLIPAEKAVRERSGWPEALASRGCNQFHRTRGRQGARVTRFDQPRSRAGLHKPLRAKLSTRDFEKVHPGRQPFVQIDVSTGILIAPREHRRPSLDDRGFGT